MSNLALVTSEQFGTVNCDFYSDENHDICMTREQIGVALDYNKPSDAISKIHKRHVDRLRQFSGVVKLSTPQGGTQSTYIYYPKGIYEICRYSRQPKADAFMDWVWDVIEGIRKGSQQSSRTDIQSLRMMVDMLEEHNNSIVKLKTANTDAIKRIDELETKYKGASAIHLQPLKAKKFNVLDELLRAFSNRKSMYTILSGHEELDAQLIQLAKDCIEDMRDMNLRAIYRRGAAYRGRTYGSYEYEQKLKDEGITRADFDKFDLPQHYNRHNLFYQGLYNDREYMLIKLCSMFDDIYRRGRDFNMEVAT